MAFPSWKSARSAASSPTRRAPRTTAASRHDAGPDQWPGPWQRLDEDEILDSRHRRPRHHQQLRHRLHALGHLRHRRGKLVWLLPPRRRRVGPGRRHRTQQRLAGALWPRKEQRKPPRLGNRRRRRQVRALGHHPDRRIGRRHGTTTATSSTPSATWSRSIPTTRTSPSASARPWAGSPTKAPPSANSQRESRWPSTWATTRAVSTSTSSCPPPTGMPRTPTRPTASPPATSTWTAASSMLPSTAPTVPANGSS